MSQQKLVEKLLKNISWIFQIGFSSHALACHRGWETTIGSRKVIVKEAVTAGPNHRHTATVLNSGLIEIVSNGHTITVGQFGSISLDGKKIFHSTELDARAREIISEVLPTLMQGNQERRSASEQAQSEETGTQLKELMQM
ncbi:hypothetical protein EXS65_04420 [Candidatus Peribacteria bacterium]|nr:hypothetical protein [Candidatus Peribacteria bacterium]